MNYRFGFQELHDRLQNSQFSLKQNKSVIVIIIIIIIIIIITFTLIAPFPLLSNGALQQQLFNNLFHLMSV